MKTWRVLALTLSIFTINLIGISSASADYALTSVPFQSGKEVTGITASNDGTKIAVASSGNGIYTSADSGASWVNRTSSLSPQPSWTAIVSSSDGRYIAASAAFSSNSSDGVYISSDFGLTWDKTLTQGAIASIAMSSDGSKIIAALSAGGSAGVTSIHRSSDFGATWSNSISGIPALARTGNYFQLTISDDGVHLAASYSSNDWAVRGLIISSNSGDSWTQITTGIPVGLARIAASADGSKIAYKVSGSPVYFSSDYGVSWTNSSWLDGNANGLSLRDNGNVIILIESGDTTDTIYISMDGGASGSNQILSPGGENNRWEFFTNRTGTKVYLVSGYALISTLDLTPVVTTPSAEELAAEAAAQAAGKAAADLVAQRELEIKREADKQSARVEISKNYSNLINPRFDLFATAEIYGVTIKNLPYISIEMMALDTAPRSEIINVVKVSNKYKILDAICVGDKFTSIYAQDLTQVGLTSKENQTTITYALRMSPVADRDSYFKISSVISEQLAIIKIRNERLLRNRLKYK